MKRTVQADSPPLSFARDRNANEPSYLLEKQCHDFGYTYVGGIDEAGRGPLAGPVVCACVVLDPKDYPAGLNDSKKLPQAKRDVLFDQITQSSLVSISVQSNHTIDDINIRQATLSGMQNAAMGLPIQVNSDRAIWFLVDGRDVPVRLRGQASNVVGGDAQSLSIAAASIVAKVTRDRIMARADQLFPQYGFSAHKGYGTKTHLNRLKQYGPCPLHRHSFAPVRITPFL